jgi:hypothetical protein
MGWAWTEILPISASQVAWVDRHAIALSYWLTGGVMNFLSQTTIVLSSASQVAWITGISHLHLVDILNFNEVQCLTSFIAHAFCDIASNPWLTSKSPRFSPVIFHDFYIFTFAFNPWSILNLIFVVSLNLKSRFILIYFKALLLYSILFYSIHQQYTILVALL